MDAEKRVATRARKGEIKNAVLQAVAIAGLFTVAIAMPNAPKAIPKSVLKKIFDRSPGSRMVTVTRLLKEGLLVVENHNGMRMFRITERGRRYLARAISRVPASSRRWDKRWRIVMFDIKEDKRGVRRSLRYELQAYGFYRLQDSVWVYPYPCEDFITLLKADLHTGKDILYLVAEEVENEKHLREIFGLPGC